MLQCYGLTETSGPITLCDGVKSKYHHSIGRLIPLMEAKIVDIRTGKSLPPNKYGELRVRGPPVMQGICYMHTNANICMYTLIYMNEYLHILAFKTFARSRKLYYYAN